MAGVEVDFKDVCEGICLIVKEDGKTINPEELNVTNEEKEALTAIYEINKAYHKEARSKDMQYIYWERQRDQINSVELLEDGIRINDSLIVIYGGIVQKPDGGEFYTAEDFSKFYFLTPRDVVIIIRKFIDILHVYNLSSKDRNSLYNEHDPIEVVDLLTNVRFHYIDVGRYHTLLQNEISNDNLTVSHETHSKNDYPPLVEACTPVNAAMWEASCRAACTLLVEIMENPQATDLIKNEFLDMLGKKYSGKGGVHSKVETIAWAALPASKKHGAGCPKKNPKNS